MKTQFNPNNWKYSVEARMAQHSPLPRLTEAEAKENMTGAYITLEDGRTQYCEHLSERERRAVNHADKLAEALHSTAHDIADAMLWIADSESTPARKFEGVAVCLRHSQQQRVKTLAAYESEVR